jgi:uncharacterized protein
MEAWSVEVRSVEVWDVEPDMNDRTCIVTRQARPAEELIRFVAAPDGTVVPDLKRRLPGRGCWVSAERRVVDEAVRRKLFARALKAPVAADEALGARVDSLLAASALGSLGLARKAGAVATGAAKVESALRSGKARLVLHALDAAADGVRKIDQARRAVAFAGGPNVPALSLFTSDEFGLALGGVNVIHAAVLGSAAADAFIKRVWLLDRYRGGGAEETDRKAAGAAKETEQE